MRIARLLLGAVVSALLGHTVATVKTAEDKDKTQIGKNIRIICTVDGGESFRAWKLPSGKLVTTIDLNLNPHVEENSLRSQYNLVITNVKLSDGGSYECLGNKNSAPFLLQIDFVLATTSPQSLHLNKKDTIMLTAQGFPKVEVKWTKDGKDVVLSNRIRLNGVSLEFQVVLPGDGGIYGYLVSQYGGSHEEQGTIEVVVVEKPTFTIKPIPTYRRLTQGFNTTFKCNATGMPNPVITFKYKVSQKEIDPHYTPRYTLTEASWKITDVQSEDKGIYVCEAKNDAGIIITGFEVVAVDVPPKFDTSSEDLVKKIGDKVQLQCKTDEGVPTPTVKWMKDEQRYVGQKFNGDRSQSVITFSKVRLADSGTYTCEARNRAVDDNGKMIVARKIVILNIRSLPVLNEKASPSEVYSSVGNESPVSIRCEFFGYPAPDVTLRAANGTELAKGKHLAVFTLRTKHPNDFGNFTCEATNEFGNAKVEIELKIAVAPTKPRDVQYEKTCNKITLKWKVPINNGGLPVFQYTISVDGYAENVGATDDKMEHTLGKDFKPDTSYQVKITARSKAGESGLEIVVIKTNKYCVPGKPVITNKETKLEENKLTLVWDKPDYDGGDSQITYKVQWKVSSDQDAKVYTKEGIKENRLEITGLEYNTEYEVKIYAVNEQGQGEPVKKYFTVGKGSGTNPLGPQPTTDTPNTPITQNTPARTSTGQPAVPGQRDGGPQAATGSLSKGAIAGIVIAVILIVLIAIDLFCCFFNSCGLFFCFSNTICGGASGKGDKSNNYNDSNVAEMEKQHLPENA